MNIAILGGSFNPPHFGHINISLLGRKACGADKVIWIITPQNPLKSKSDTLPFAKRWILCEEIIEEYRQKGSIFLSDLDYKKNNFETINTLKLLRRKYPNDSLFWICGTDNFANIHKWKGYEKFLKYVNICVFSRNIYSHSKIINSQFYQKAKRESRVVHLLQRSIKNAPKRGGLFIVHSKMFNVSSTELRAKSNLLLEKMR